MIIIIKRRKCNIDLCADKEKQDGMISNNIIVRAIKVYKQVTDIMRHSYTLLDMHRMRILTALNMLLLYTSF